LIRRHSTETGSIAPLGIGLFLLVLSVLLTFIAASSLFIFQKRLTNISESAALFLAANDANLDTYLEQIDLSGLDSLQLRSNVLSDEKTIRVKACAIWATPSIGVLNLSQKEICSHASARVGQ
jgi:Flp pilus assembly protein TadG